MAGREDIVAAARRLIARGGNRPAQPPGAGTVHALKGVTPLGASPSKKPNKLIRAVPRAPGVATRVNPGVVPPRLRGRRRF